MLAIRMPAESASHPELASPGKPGRAWERGLSSSTHLDSVFALREVLLALLGLLQLPRGVFGGQAAADGTGLLGAEIEGHVLLVLVEQAHVVSLLGVDDGQDTSDRLAEVVAVLKEILLVSHTSIAVCSC